MKKTISITLILAILTTPLLSYAQTTGLVETPISTNTSTVLTEPNQTTVFFTDPEQAKEIIETADTTYMSESEIPFTSGSAQSTIIILDQGIKELRNQIIKLDRKYGTDDKQYLETRNEVVSIINEIEKTKNTLSSSIKKIYFYQKNIINSVEKVSIIRANLRDTKNYVQKFAQFMYKINNEYYNTDGTLDELKLFIKTDGEISEQLSNTALIETVMQKMNTLMSTLTTQEKETITQIKLSNKNRTEIRKIITEYENRLKDLQEQRKFLADYLTLYESNKTKMTKELANLFSTRSEVYGDINTTIAAINDKNYTNTPFDMKKKLEELNKTEAFAVRDENAAPLSWPLYPVIQISRYFWDADYKDKYKIPFNGIEIPAEQNSPLYAVDEGLVYKIANKDGIWLNWVLLVHKNNRMTVYLYPNKVIVQEGDIVRRWQIIWYSGWEPWTKGAGFVAWWPNLTFMVVENGKIVNPIDYLDLSILQDKSKIPTGYKFRYLKDKYNLPREMYAVKPMVWASVEERRQNLLNTYGVWVYRQSEFWQDASSWTNIDVDVGICIAFAESTLGNYLSTSNNIGNVGNNDRWDRIAYQGPMVGARLIYTTLNNAYLWQYHILLDYNGYGNPDGKNYATSKYNWQNNVTKCLSMIKWYYIPDDFPVRIAPNPNLK
jgi:murein DD-endopeptidase MepM/ murein hydrolase activator NlpD